MLLAIDTIKIGKRLRGLREGTVADLTGSIGRMGLQTPISVATGIEKRSGDADGITFQLVTGAHRLEACRRLGWEEIEATIVQMTDDQRLLWEIDENLCRAGLTELERGEHLAQRKAVYERLYPETREHVAGGIARHAATADSAVAGFAADAADKIGIADRTIRQSIRRATKIDAKVRDQIRDNPDIADSGVELDALADLDADQQKRAIKMVASGEVKSVREAKAKIAPPGPRSTSTTRTAEHAQEAPEDGLPVRDDSAAAADQQASVFEHESGGNAAVLGEQQASVFEEFPGAAGAAPGVAVPGASASTPDDTAADGREVGESDRHLSGPARPVGRRNRQSVVEAGIAMLIAAFVEGDEEDRLMGGEAADNWTPDKPLMSDDVTALIDQLMDFESRFRSKHGAGNDAALAEAA